MEQQAQQTLPKSYMSEAEREELKKQGASQNLIYLEECGAAQNAGDLNAAWAWIARCELPAYSLSFLKKKRGADFIRKLNFNTTEADKTYGKGWLDR